MNIWRIYRLPGSREWWHIDTGRGTQIFNVRGYESRTNSKSVDYAIGQEQPRAWIEIERWGTDLHIINDIAIFEPSFLNAVNFVASTNKLPEETKE